MKYLPFERRQLAALAQGYRDGFRGILVVVTKYGRSCYDATTYARLLDACLSIAEDRVADGGWYADHDDAENTGRYLAGVADGDAEAAYLLLMLRADQGCEYENVQLEPLLYPRHSAPADPSPRTTRVIHGYAPLQPGELRHIPLDQTVHKRIMAIAQTTTPGADGEDDTVLLLIFDDETMHGIVLPRP
jgi:hypothetical protein